jgi:hypothetical protein
MADATRVLLVPTPELGLAKCPTRKEHADTPIGNFTANLTRFLKLQPNQQLHLFVTKAGSAFIPAPDQTVGDLFKAFGTEHPTDGPSLQLSYCTKVYQG